MWMVKEGDPASLCRAAIPRSGGVVLLVDARHLLSVYRSVRARGQRLGRKACGLHGCTSFCRGARSRNPRKALHSQSWRF